jgi:hypothetical protein
MEDGLLTGTRWEFSNTVVGLGELALKLGRLETDAVIFGAAVGCMALQHEAVLQELRVPWPPRRWPGHAVPGCR